MTSKFKKLFYTIFIVTSINGPTISADDLKSVGKYKDWETFTMMENDKKVCFVQSIPVLKAPKKFERDASRLFVSFRPSDEIKDEVSVTSGYNFQKKYTVKAKSGKKTFDFFSQENFAWILDDKEEKRFIQAMKRASRVMVIGKTDQGQQTIDHYSLMGFTKAYNTAKKSCS